MIDHIPFQFNEHPVIGLSLMVCFLSGSVLLNFVGMAQDCVPFFQIAACCMTVFVGYRTLKHLGKK